MTEESEQEGTGKDEEKGRYEKAELRRGREEKKGGGKKGERK